MKIKRLPKNYGLMTSAALLLLFAFTSGTVMAGPLVQVTADSSRILEEMPEAIAPGVELSQWGDKFFEPYHRDKYQEEVEWMGSLYRTGLNLRFHVSDISENLDQYMENLKYFDGPMLSYLQNDATFVLTIYGMPKWLSSKCFSKADGTFQCESNFGAAPPNDYEAWAQLVKSIVSYYKHDLGLDLWYEIWNEPDQGYYFNNTDFWLGTKEEYFKLYAYAVKGALEADGNARIGGPAASVYDKGVIEDFIQFASEELLPIDFVTWHSYVGWNDFWGTESAYKEMTGSISGWLEDYGYSTDTPLVMDEWNYDSSLFDTIEHTTEHDSAYVIYALMRMLEGGITKQCFFNFIDFDDAPLFSGSTGTMSNLGVIKPVYNAMKAVSILSGKMGGQKASRLHVENSGEDCFLTAMASQTSDQNKVRVLISNYIPSLQMLKYGFPPSLYRCASKYYGQPRDVALELINLPFTGSATVTTYLIDKTHANSCNYNKRTEPQPSSLICGDNGIVSQMVAQASSEAHEKSLPAAEEVLAEEGYTQPQIRLIIEKVFDPCAPLASRGGFERCAAKILGPLCVGYDSTCVALSGDIMKSFDAYKVVFDDLFYYGIHQPQIGELITTSMYIEKINNDPNISLEGSRQAKEVEIGESVYEEVFQMEPYSVLLIELSAGPQAGAN